MKGTDISSFQQGIDFHSSDVEVIYIKATEGLSYVNPCLRQQYGNAKANGKKVGFYHFLRDNDPTDEARHFLDTIQGLEADLKYCIDAETNFDGVSSHVRHFADYLISQGKEPILYTGFYFYRDNLDSTVKDLPLWVAAYQSTRPNVNSVGWQYTDKGNINGITVDLDVFEDSILLNSNPVAQASEDNSVRELQHNLNRLFNAGLAEDNIQGPATNAAIKKWGQILGGSGVNELLALTNQVLAFPLIKMGSTGSAVRYVQFRVGAYVDGYFGPITNSKVESYQNTLKDGIVGPQTWSQLMK